MSEAVQINAISKVISDLPPGLSAEAIARLVLDAIMPLTTIPDPTPVPTPTPDPVPTLTDEQAAFLALCRDQGSVSVSTSSTDATMAAELGMMGYVTAAAGGDNFILWRLTRSGTEQTN